MGSKREQELEEILRQLVPATRDILWCALVWNDHNFSEKDLRDKAARAARVLGFPPGGLCEQVDNVNAWLERVDNALGSVQQRGGDLRG